MQKKFNGFLYLTPTIELELYEHRKAIKHVEVRGARKYTLLDIVYLELLHLHALASAGRNSNKSC
jgi:hypothetical protein